MLFSWASGAETVDYAYDRDSVLVGPRPTGGDAAAHRQDQGAQHRHHRAFHGHVSHHGNPAPARHIGDRDLSGKLGYVILASPDIDVDVFKTQMTRYGKPDRPFAILQSADDRALKVSRIISGDKPRLGQYEDAADLATYGVIVVDLTKTESGDRLNHAKFADNPVIVKLLGERLRAPASLTVNEVEANRQIEQVGQGLGKAVGGVAEIIITTPFKILTLGTGG